MDIVRFKGGLGYQMFQYALVEALRNRKRDVRCNLGFYRKWPEAAPFVLNQIFHEIHLQEVDDYVFEEIDERWKRVKQDAKLFEDANMNKSGRFFYVEEKDCVYEKEVFQTTNCVFVGYWQTELYFNNIRDILLKDYKFPYGEEKLEYFKYKFLNGDTYVAVHVRRGDYLNNPQLWGNLGNSGYYQKSIEMIQDRIPDAQLVFFSNDMLWVKQNLKYENAIYMEHAMFDDYKDWYDMELMSCCTHNIIANSSFSWWGAWLNQNSNKMVIAPERWFFDRTNQDDICPNDWIRVKI